MRIVNILFALVVSLGAFAQNYEIVSETKSNDGKYTAIVINYESVDVDMVTPVTVSGLVTIPTSGTADCILLDEHFTATDNPSVPSVNKGPYTYGGYITGRYVVVETDYIGYGLTSDRVHPYLCSNHSAQNSIDLAKIARKLIAERGVQLKADMMFVTGYSQGGSVALCAHRLLDMNPELAKELHFAGSFCGGGAYDLPTVTKWYLDGDKSEDMSMAMIMLYAARGFLTGMPELFAPGRQFSEFCSDRVNNSNVVKLMDEKKTNLIEMAIRVQLLCYGSKKVKDYVSADVMDPNSTLRKEMDAAAEANTFLDDWKPTTPLVIYHVVQDDIICIQNVYNAINRLGMKRSDHILINQPGASHITHLTQYYAQVNKLIDERINEYITGIKDVKESNGNNGKCYDLNGRQVDESYRGIVVKNGKKVMQ